MNKRAEYIVVNKEKEDKIDLIRNSFSNMYDVIDINCNNSPAREIELGIQKLEEAQFWIIKGITREEV